MSINERIKRLVEERAKSQNEFGRLIGVSSTRISNIIKGRNKPDSEMLALIAKTITDLNTHWLLTGDGDPWVQRLYQGFTKYTYPTMYTNKEVHLTKFLRENPDDIRNQHLLLPAPAHAGYAIGFPDDGWEESGVRILNIPFAPKKARTIEVSGDSMEPKLSDGDWIICRYIENKEEISGGKIYAVVSTNTGISVKYIEVRSSDLKLIPANTYSHSPERLQLNEVKEIWEVILKITKNFLSPEEVSNAKQFNERISHIERFLMKQISQFNPHYREEED